MAYTFVSSSPIITRWTIELNSSTSIESNTRYLFIGGKVQFENLSIIEYWVKHSWLAYWLSIKLWSFIKKEQQVSFKQYCTCGLFVCTLLIKLHKNEESTIRQWSVKSLDFIGIWRYVNTWFQGFKSLDFHCEYLSSIT